MDGEQVQEPRGQRTGNMDWRLNEVERQQGAQWRRLEPVKSHSERLDALDRRFDKADEAVEKLADRFSAEIGDLRRTIIQAMISVFIASIGILVTLATVIK